MRNHTKPVRKCHGCTLNLGDHCWLFAYPRGQWRGGRQCRAYENEAIRQVFEQWQRRADVKDRRTMRQEMHGRKRPRAGGEGAAWVHERGLL